MRNRKVLESANEKPKSARKKPKSASDIQQLLTLAKLGGKLADHADARDNGRASQAAPFGAESRAAEDSKTGRPKIKLHRNAAGERAAHG